MIINIFSTTQSIEISTLSIMHRCITYKYIPITSTTDREEDHVYESGLLLHKFMAMNNLKSLLCHLVRRSREIWGVPSTGTPLYLYLTHLPCIFHYSIPPQCVINSHVFTWRTYIIIQFQICRLFQSCRQN